jgi:hypothetical protein
VEFICKNGVRQSFGGVYFIPQLTANIVSVGRLDEDGYQVIIGGGKLVIREPDGKLLARVKKAENRLYLLTMKLSTMECLLSQAEVVTRRWHERLGHINYQAMKMSREGLVRGLPDMVSVDHPCGACLEGKQRRSMFPAQA